MKETLSSLLKNLRMFSKFGEQEIYVTVQGKITIFKTLATSKVIHLTLVTDVPHVIIGQLNKMQKDFICN